MYYKKAVASKKSRSMFGIINLPIFISASILLNLVPGPDAVYIMTRSLSQGKRAGFISSAGVCSGALIHAIAAALGLSAILTTSAYAFTVVKLIGAVYLVFLGVRTFIDKSNPLSFNEDDNENSSLIDEWTLFKQGVLVDVLNPQVAIFFLAFLPQFIDPNYGQKTLTFLILGMIVIAIALVYEAVLVVLCGAISSYLRRNKTIGRYLNRFVGTVYAALGIKLAAERL